MAERFSSFCNSTTTALWGGSIFKIATESLFLCSEFFIEKSDGFWILQRLPSASHKMFWSKKNVDEYQRKVLSVPSLSFYCILYLIFFNFSRLNFVFETEFCKNSSSNSFWNFSQNSDWNFNHKSNQIHFRNFLIFNHLIILGNY